MKERGITDGLTMNQLAERNAEHVTTIAALEARCAALVAENAGLKYQEPAGYHVIKECGKVGCSVATLEEAEKTRDFWNKNWTIRPYFYSAQPASERERIRREHAEWSDATFGDVGPVGPLKHLSKEALEAAADPSDPLEWADMQFLLWDAQRRMGISDEFITRAMIEKLEINKTRQWPEPKDGEPRLHIKEQPESVVPEECPAELPYAQVKAVADLYALCWQSGEVVTYTPDPEKATIWINNYSGTCVQEYVKLERLQEALAGNSPVIPGGWISCSERMPDNDESKPIAIFTGKCLGQGMFVATYDDDGFFDYWEGMEIIGVSHWMPLPAAPQQE
ncbi:TPA: dATP/dGTP pyrophosphohydrolase domain-containing protein [Salmonella enterica subsp. enterica serovar Java]|nr:DUF550 domain-containing protein [Salmonella enterica]MDJ7311329.1 DUF550 domain-containing protein [Salmonella enterica]MDJ7686025.1 DUF550 domain-containing protein [Salmonella enterica]MDJ8574092.1 DUF550 domain-containing protein [Salmonella enterica]